MDALDVIAPPCTLKAMLDHPSIKTLLEKQEKQNNLGSVLSLLGWDEQVNLPPESANQRARQMATLSEINHSLASDASIEELLKVLESDWDNLSQKEQTVVKHSRKDYDRATRLPADYVRDKAMLDSQAYHAWVQARENNDF